MLTNDNDYLSKEFDIEKNVPQVTLTDDFAPKDVGSMVVEAEKAVFGLMIEQEGVWRSNGKRFMKILIYASASESTNVLGIHLQRQLRHRSNCGRHVALGS